MPHTVESLKADYPEFGDLQDNAIKLQLGQSKIMLSSTVWGKYFQMAQGLWCAHYLALDWDITGNCAELGKKSPYDVGTANNQTASTNSLSIGLVTSAMLSGDDPILADFGRTRYGMRYLNLLYTVIPAGAVVYSPDTSATLAGR